MKKKTIILLSVIAVLVAFVFFSGLRVEFKRVPNGNSGKTSVTISGTESYRLGTNGTEQTTEYSSKQRDGEIRYVVRQNGKETFSTNVPDTVEFDPAFLNLE